MITTVPLLETGRLRLRPFAPADAPAVQHLAGAWEVARTTLNIPHPYPDGLAATWIEGQAAAAAAGTGYTWAITRRPDALLLGAISLIPSARHQRAEMGYWLGVPYWNQGYMSEAARRVVEFGFQELGLHRVQATCLPRNVASARVMEKAGLTFEGLLRGYVRKGEQFEDIAMYARLRPPAGERSAP
jgi:RimJ/RimL family protein N-acetyltransferase